MLSGEQVKVLRCKDDGNWKVSDFRWSCQVSMVLWEQFSVVWERIDIIIEVLQYVIDNDCNSSRNTEATDHLLQIDRRFLRYLLIIKHILKKAKFSSGMLQKPTNDLTEAIVLIAVLKEELPACRSSVRNFGMRLKQ